MFNVIHRAMKCQCLDHLRDEGLIRSVAIDADQRADVLTDRGWDVLDAHRRERGSGFLSRVRIANATAGPRS
jgi:hypothetical protein